MTEHQAEEILSSFTKPAASHDGLCLVGLYMTPSHPYPAFEVSGPVITLKGIAVTYLGVVEAPQGHVSTDIRRLREIRLLPSHPGGICPGAKLGYAIALKDDQKLTGVRAQISLNAVSAAELDQVLGMLMYFSPHARLVSGIGY